MASTGSPYLLRMRLIGVKAVVHFGQFAGIEIELVEVAGQIERDFFQRDRRVADAVGDRA